jgi:hypothetical protein
MSVYYENKNFNCHLNKNLPLYCSERIKNITLETLLKKIKLIY